MNVYDFDNTIYRGESGVDLFLSYLKKDPRLLIKLPWAISCILKYKAGKISLDDVMEKYAGVVEEFAQSIEDIESDVIDFCFHEIVTMRINHITEFVMAKVTCNIRTDCCTKKA